MTKIDGFTRKTSVVVILGLIIFPTLLSFQEFQNSDNNDINPDNSVEIISKRLEEQKFDHDNNFEIENREIINSSNFINDINKDINENSLKISNTINNRENSVSKNRINNLFKIQQKISTTTELFYENQSDTVEPIFSPTDSSDEPSDHYHIYKRGCSWGLDLECGTHLYGIYVRGGSDQTYSISAVGTDYFSLDIYARSGKRFQWLRIQFQYSDDEGDSWRNSDGYLGWESFGPDNYFQSSYSYTFDRISWNNKWDLNTPRQPGRWMRIRVKYHLDGWLPGDDYWLPMITIKQQPAYSISASSLSINSYIGNTNTISQSFTSADNMWGVRLRLFDVTSGSTSPVLDGYTFDNYVVSETYPSYDKDSAYQTTRIQLIPPIIDMRTATTGYLKSFTLVDGKIYELEFRARTYNGNLYLGSRKTFIYDDSNPSITSTKVINGGTLTNNWYRSQNAQSRILGTDSGSGINTIQSTIIRNSDNTLVQSWTAMCSFATRTTSSTCDSPEFTQFGDGEYTVTWKITDNVGKWHETTHNFKIDSQTPFLTGNPSKGVKSAVSASKSGWYNSKEIKAYSKFSDQTLLSGIDSVQYQVKDRNGDILTNWLSASLDENLQYQYNSEELDLEGELYLYWRATDKAGNVYSDSNGYQILIDVTKPSLHIEKEPMDSTWISSRTVTYQLLIDDNGGSNLDLTSFEYSVDGSYPKSISEVLFNSETKILTYSVTYSSDGSHFITFYSRDLANNINQTQSQEVLIDTTRPVQCTSGSCVTLLPSGWQTTNNINFTISFSDMGSGINHSSLVYLLDNTPVNASTSSATLINFNEIISFSLFVSDGKDHIVTVIVADNVGNIINSPIIINSINVDSLAPKAEYLLEYDTWFSTSSIQFLVSYEEKSSGINPERFFYILDNDQPVAISSTKYNSATKVLSLTLVLSDGQHSIIFFGEDNAGLVVETEEVVVGIDNETPNISFPDYAQNDSWHESGNNYTVTIDETISGINSYRYWYSFETRPNWKNTNNLDINITIPDVNNGLYMIYFEVCDTAGNIAHIEYHYHIDNNEPIITWINPQNTITGSFTIDIEVSVPSKIDYEYYWNDRWISFNGSLNTTKLSFGIFELPLKAIATDNTGKITTFKQNITVKNVFIEIKSVVNPLQINTGNNISILVELLLLGINSTDIEISLYQKGSYTYEDTFITTLENKFSTNVWFTTISTKEEDYGKNLAYYFVIKTQNTSLTKYSDSFDIELIDTQTPSLSLLKYPSTEHEITDEILFEIQVSDTGSGINYDQMLINYNVNNQWESVQFQFFNGTFIGKIHKTDTLGVGVIIEYYISIADNDGNIHTSSRASIILVDTKGPEIVFNYRVVPYKNTENQLFTINGSGSDPSIVKSIVLVYRTQNSGWIEQSLGTNFESSMQIGRTNFDFYLRAADFLGNAIYYIPGNTTSDESIAKQNPYKLLFLSIDEGSNNKITNNNPIDLLTLLVIGGTAVLIITAVTLLKKKNKAEF